MHLWVWGGANLNLPGNVNANVFAGTRGHGHRVPTIIAGGHGCCAPTIAAHGGYGL